MASKSHFTKEEVYAAMRNQGLNPENEADINKFLISMVESAKEYSYPPYSKFYVGAAALLENGDIVLGANAELSSDLVNTIHAEQAVIIQAMRLGQPIKKLAVNHPPCGFCRQSLAELNDGLGIEIFFDSQQEFLSQLLPFAFTPKNLGQKHQPPFHERWDLLVDQNWSLVPEGFRKLLQEELRHSYAPDTLSPAAVVLETTDGSLYTGRYFENAAYNPTISAVRFVLVNMMMQRKCQPTGDLIQNIWLVFSNDSQIDHLGQTQQILSHINCAAKLNVISVATKLHAHADDKVYPKITARL